MRFSVFSFSLISVLFGISSASHAIDLGFEDAAGSLFQGTWQLKALECGLTRWEKKDSKSSSWKDLVIQIEPEKWAFNFQCSPPHQESCVLKSKIPAFEQWSFEEKDHTFQRYRLSLVSSSTKIRKINNKEKKPPNLPAEVLLKTQILDWIGSEGIFLSSNAGRDLLLSYQEDPNAPEASPVLIIQTPDLVSCKIPGLPHPSNLENQLKLIFEGVPAATPEQPEILPPMLPKHTNSEQTAELPSATSTKNGKNLPKIAEALPSE